ncbi:hypothetical protein CMT25_13985 [Elizabethkingia anophelis]|uniref:sce7725 family protein n=1 Tax=Elizabethkingia anophelis TaxID=1117645 RepID=UPI0009999AC7|nr:sce7725 family protein [Elizabethkingia anophelis]MDV4131257.1 hypothetical protein [Elizabethkingia anophelis]MDV4132958.1 hypothetical protein [Elizabethkingia anophelis]OPC60034.1 hypothetical protein BAY08_13605 [Elizabethkingia anophelis]
MYFPYLRSKQAELDALLNVKESVYSTTIPIIEPVSLKKIQIDKIIKLAQRNLAFILILNPKIKKHPEYDEIIELVEKGGLSIYNNFYIGYLVDSSLSKIEIEKFISVRPDLKKVLIHQGEFDDLSLLNRINEHIQYNVFIENNVSGSYLTNFNINKILIRDGFEKKSKNADYPAKSFFYDLNNTFKNFGFIGFGDFSVIGNVFSESGGPAQAVAIHLTVNENNNIYIRHFLSDNRIGTKKTPEKFLEALTHSVTYIKVNKISPTSGIKNYMINYDKLHFPGLAKNKEYSIKNHIEVINDSF